MIRVQKMITKKRFRRGDQLKIVDHVTPNDEVMDDKIRLGLCGRKPGSVLIWIAEVSESEQVQTLELLKARDNKATGRDDDYADRQIIKAPILKGDEHDDTSETE